MTKSKEDTQIFQKSSTNDRLNQDFGNEIQLIDKLCAEQKMIAKKSLKYFQDRCIYLDKDLMALVP